MNRCQRPRSKAHALSAENSARDTNEVCDRGQVIIRVPKEEEAQGCDVVGAGKSDVGRAGNSSQRMRRLTAYMLKFLETVRDNVRCAPLAPENSESCGVSGSARANQPSSGEDRARRRRGVDGVEGAFM